MLYTFALTWHSAWHIVSVHSVNVLLNECMVLAEEESWRQLLISLFVLGLGKTVLKFKGIWSSWTSRQCEEPPLEIPV